VKLALHAGELSLGMVQPEGLTFHIKDAIDVAGANRIGHGMDIAHESNPLAIMKKMRDAKIAVEVNLSSNDFILGIKEQAHPVTLYRKYGVPFVLSTDDAGVSRNNLSGNMCCTRRVTSRLRGSEKTVLRQYSLFFPG
jgi:adenosine deaminase/adenosine deaminase CECR1